MKTGSRVGRRVLALVLVGGTLAVATATARAAGTVSDCQKRIETLRLLTEGVTSFVNQRDESGLLGKLGDAASKLDQLKFADSIAKLTDYFNKVVELSAKAKIGAADAADLEAGAQDAIACVQALSH